MIVLNGFSKGVRQMWRGYGPMNWPRDHTLRFGIVFSVIWFLLGGAAHFVFTEGFTSIVPAYVPYPRFWVLLTGVCEIAGAGALLIGPRLRSAAGLALAALTICVTPANVEMLLHAERYPSVGGPLLAARLAFQPILIWITWRATRIPAV